jgi:hypothetical protein
MVCGWTWTSIRVLRSMVLGCVMSAVVIASGLLRLAGRHVAVSPSGFLSLVPSRRPTAGAAMVAISVVITIVIAYAVMITMIVVVADR